MKTHWMTWTKIHRVWKNMNKRCNNSHTEHFKYYWWRWINVCDRRRNFQSFYEDMWPSYKEWLSIDRIDVNGNYCKENCKWSTKKEQMRNTRRNKKIAQKNKLWDIIRVRENRIDIKDELWYNIWNIRSCCKWIRNEAHWFIREYFNS